MHGVFWEYKDEQLFRLPNQETLPVGGDIDFSSGLSKHFFCFSSVSNFSLDLKLFEYRDNTLFPLPLSF